MPTRKQDSIIQNKTFPIIAHVQVLHNVRKRVKRIALLHRIRFANVPPLEDADAAQREWLEREAVRRRMLDPTDKAATDKIREEQGKLLKDAAVRAVEAEAKLVGQRRKTEKEQLLKRLVTDELKQHVHTADNPHNHAILPKAQFDLGDMEGGETKRRKSRKSRVSYAAAGLSSQKTAEDGVHSDEELYEMKGMQGISTVGV